MIKGRYISCFYFCFFLIFSEINVHAYSDKNYKEVGSNKIWVVKFNKKIDCSNLNKSEIIIKDSSGSLINYDVLNGDDSNEIKILPPKGGYKFDERYTLVITKQAYPQLQEESNMNFTIANQNFSNEPAWDDRLTLYYNNKVYTVTNETTTDINSQIYTAIYNGPIGNIYKLYSINNIGNYSKIAVKTKNGYLIAIAPY